MQASCNTKFLFFYLVLVFGYIYFLDNLENIGKYEQSVYFCQSYRYILHRLRSNNFPSFEVSILIFNFISIFDRIKALNDCLARAKTKYI